MQTEDDILSGGLVPLDTPTDRDPQSLVHRTAARINVPADIADDYLQLTGKVESGNRQYDKSGRPLLGPPTKRTGARALGFGQVMPDAKGGTTRTISGRRYDLTNPDENVEAGLRLFNAGGPDPIARRLEYFGGAGARRQYERTGRIPEGGDGYTSYQQYVRKSLGRPTRRRPAESDILAGGLVEAPTSPQTPDVPPAITEMAVLGAQSAALPPLGEPPAPATVGTADANVAAAPPPTAPSVALSARDAAWHFGMNPQEAQRLTRRQLRVLGEAVAEDERKKAAGQPIDPPPLNYQNELRKRAGLRPLQFNVARPTARIGNIELTGGDPNKAVSPYYQPEPGELPSGRGGEPIKIRPDDRPFRFNEDPAVATRRQKLIQAEIARRENELNSGVITPERRNTPGYFTVKNVEEAIDKQIAGEGDQELEIARLQRIAGMGWGEYAAQAPKSALLGLTDTGATALKGVAALAKAHGTIFRTGGDVDTKDTPVYQLGQAISDSMRSAVKSDPGLERDFVVGQSPQVIGQVTAFMLGGWASRSPQLATVILGSGMTAGDAYDEVRANGGSDNDAVIAGLLAGGLLGPTEVIGMRGAMKALSGTAKAATWRAALKTALQEGRRDMIENALQEVGQEFGQGVITGNRRSMRDLFQAGTLGGFGGTVTIPLTAITSRPRSEPQPLVSANDVHVRDEEGPIQLPAVDRPIVAEKPSAIAAQMDALQNRRGNRLAVMIPTGQAAPGKIPKGYRTTRTPEGVVIHPKEIASEDIVTLVETGESWRLLGHTNPDTPNATRVVVARAGRDGAGGIQAGDELWVSYVTPGMEQDVIDEGRSQFAPYAPTFEVGGAETAERVVQERSSTLVDPQGTQGAQGDSAIPESTKYSVPVDSKLFPDRSHAQAFSKQGLRGLDVPTQRLVMARVLAAIHDPQIRDAVVETIPVDVVDNLLLAKSPSQVVLHDEDVLQDAASTGDVDQPIPTGTDAIDALVRRVADVTAKMMPVRSELGKGLGTGSPAVVASEGDSLLAEPPTRTTTESSGTAENLRSRADNRGTAMIAGGGHEANIAQRVSGTGEQPRFAALSNQDLQIYITNTRERSEKRLARLKERLPKGTSRQTRETRPRVIERSERRAAERVAAAETELTRRRQGGNNIPSFSGWLETQAGGRAGGTRIETLSAEERSAMLARYDQQYYGRPHHAKFQKRRKRTGQFAPGKVSIPGEIIPRIIPAPSEGEAAPEGQLFATAPTTTKPTKVVAPTKEPTAPVKPQRGSTEYAQSAVDYQRRTAVREIAQVLGGKEVRGLRETPSEDSRIDRIVTRANDQRLETIMRVEDKAQRDALLGEVPPYTLKALQSEIDAHIKDLGATAEAEPAAEEVSTAPYVPQEGETVSWKDGDKTLTGKVLKAMPSGAFRVRISGKTAGERRVRLPGSTVFSPVTPTAKAATTRPRGRLRHDPAVDSLEKAIRAYGGIRPSDANRGEVKVLRESGKGLVNDSSDYTAEQMAMTLAEEGYGQGVFWEGSLVQGAGDFSGVDGNAFLDAAVEDATGSRKHYSTAYEADISAEEEAYWKAQMTPEDVALMEATSRFLGSAKVSRLLQEITDGQATKDKRRQLRELGKARGLDESVVNEHIRIAEEAAEQAHARDREVPDESVSATGDEGRPLGEPRVDAEGNLRDEAGNVLFAKRKSPKGWETAESGEKFPPRFSVEGNHINLENSEASELLNDAYVALGATPRNTGIGGIFTGNPEQAARQLDKMSQDGARELAAAFREAAKAGKGKVTAAFGQRSKVHEKFHESSHAANRYLQDRHGNFDQFESDPTFQKIRTALTRQMSYPDVTHVLVEESAAYIASGDYQRLGITRKEAIEYLTKWFESFIDHNGDVSVQRFKEMAEDGQEALAAALNQEATTEARQGTDEAVRRIQEGRETRAGPSAAAARRRAEAVAPAWEMSPSELEAASQKAKEAEQALLTEFFGREGAERYRKLERERDSQFTSPDEADRIQGELRNMAKALTPEQESQWEREAETAEDYGYYKDALDAITASSYSESALANALAKPLSDIGEKSNPAEMNSTERRAYAQLRYAAEIVRKEGFDPQRLWNLTLRASVRQFSNPEDAQFMLQRFFGRFPNVGVSGDPLFRRRPKETDQQYESRTKSALDRLREVAQKRGQNVRDFIPRQSEAPATTTTAPTTRTSGVTEKARSPAPLPPPRRIPHVPGERSFPKSAERAGFIGGTDRDYSVITDKAALERADRRLVRAESLDQAASELKDIEEPTKDDGAMGILLMQRFEKAGKIKEAVAVANDLSRKYTNAGQFVQSASIISRLSPEGVLLAAQKRMRRGRELPVEVARVVIQQAREVSEAEKLVEQLRRDRPDVFGPNGEILPQPKAVTERDSKAPPVTRRRARERIGKLQDRLATMEQQARERMEARARQTQAETANLPPKEQRGAGISPVAVAADLRDLVIIGASKMARTGINQAVWMAEMAKEATALTRKDLRRLYRESYEMYEAERKRFLRESRERSVQRGEPGPHRPDDYQRIINDRLDAQSRARKARAQLSRTFRDLNANRVTRGIKRARDVWNLSRSLITSVDFSASGRQGKMGIVTHPRAWLQGFARQFRALSTKQYERMMSEIELDPDYKYAVRFKLFLAGFEGTREEAFESDLVKYIPWIKHSEQAYNTMLNTLRMGWLKAQLQMARRAGLDPENPDLKEQFINDVSLINNLTGRGGGRIVDKVAPVTNTLAFSTRFWASRLRVLTLPLDPRMYGATFNGSNLSKSARVDAWRTLFGFYGLVGMQLYLAALAGAHVGLDPDDWENFVFNPDSADFLKARFGKVHVDFSAGLQTHLRVAARLSMSFYKREYEKGKPRKGPMEIGGAYLRTKMAPNPGLIYDLFLSDKKDTESGPKGTDYAGQPVYLTGKPGEGTVGRIRTSALAQKVLPIVIQDAMEAYKEGLSTTSFTGATLASVLGEGVTTYSPNYSERAQKWPMKAELEKHGVTVNPPQRIKPDKYENFKAETEEEYQARRQREAEAVKVELQRLEGMSYYKKLGPQDQEKELRAAIKAGRQAARESEPASQRQAAARP